MRFKEVRISDVLDVQWGDTKTTKSSYVASGYTAFSAAGPDGFLPHFDYDREGIVLSAIGANCGGTFFAENKWSSIKNTIRIFPKTEEIDLRFFYYLSGDKNFWPKRGSAQPFISQTDVRDMYISIPNVEIQKFIANTAMSLDKKIQKNHETASILENIAQTIFKSWFVDFDPVHAKARGEQPYGMDEETAALFPDSFEDSDLGLIPSGWSKISFGEFVVPRKGKTITKAGTKPGTVPVVAGGLEPAYFHDTANVKNPVVTVSASGANAGFVRLYLEDIWASDCSVISGEQTLYVYFSYLFLKTNQETIFDMQQGGAQPHIYPSDLMRLELFVPIQRDVLNSFNAIVQPLFDQVRNLGQQNKVLSELRDSLLPRLISGELEIPEELL